MGAGTIISGGADGLYTVKMDRGKARKDAELSRINQTIALLTANLAEYPPIIASREANIAQWQAALENAIVIYEVLVQIDPTSQQTQDAAKGVNALLAEKLNAEGSLQAVKANQNIVKGQLAEAQRRKVFITAVAAEVTQEIWCADLTEDKTGAVSTIEIPGEPVGVVMAPQSQEDALILPAGNVVARELMRADHLYLNAAILPGWQKFKPTYRRGTIVDTDTTLNTATVQIAATVSTAKDKNLKTINVNQETVLLENVPVNYMTCHAAAFEPDDDVVVMFESQDWASPRVIGFISGPKPCNVFVLAQHGSFFDPAYGPLPRSFMVAVTPTGTVIKEGIQIPEAIDYEGAFSRSIGYYVQFSGVGVMDSDDYKKVKRMTDGVETYLPERLFSLSRQKTELFGIDLERLGQRECVVLNEKTLSVKRAFEVWPYPSGYAITMDAGDGGIVVGGFASTYKLRLYDHDGTFNREIDLTGSDFIWDVSMGKDYFATIYMPGFTVPWLYVYDVTTGSLIDSLELGNGWESVTMAGDIIAVQGNIGGGSTNVSGGKLRLYKLIDGDLVLQSETNPFGNLIATYGMTTSYADAGR